LRPGVIVLIGALLLAAPAAHAGAPLRVYDVATGARTVPFASDGLGRALWALENDGTMLIARGTVRRAVVQRIGLDGRAGTRAWSPDGRLLAYEYQSEARDELRIYDVAAGATRVLMSRPRGSIDTLIWSPDSHLIGLTLAG
jgi:Tol biopolymer transport system component